MNGTLAGTGLRLYAVNPDAASNDMADLFTALQAIRLIDRATVYEVHRAYAPGSRIHKLIAFRRSHRVTRLAVVGHQ
jgi:hypothetical protein